MITKVGPWVLMLIAAFPLGANAASLQLERVPERGIQPQIATASDGTVHMIYLTGDPKAADVHYVRRAAADKEWSKPMPVNSLPGSAMAIGTIRGAQIALGRNGSVHVCWNGSSQAEPKPRLGGAPLIYTRLPSGGSRFEPQRDLMGNTRYLDGGASIAADKEGRVFVVWHGAPADKSGETNRAVYLALSKDDGVKFERERPVNPEASGACGCCGVKAFADESGDVFILFRTAREMTERAMQVLHSKDHGVNFQPEINHPWVAKQCPMSSSSFVAGPAGIFAAWETAGQIFGAKVNGNRAEMNPVAISPKRGAKHPAMAENKSGDWLVTWTEGTGWEKGGALAWKITDGAGKTETGRQDGIPKWSYAAAYAKPDGSFTVLY
ncbi:MAG TPA: hypothetical protein VMZ27_15300 [Candidatus Saccharimonadales bacterium]|nr:hypothetical protein [Candidatus Saccharimonadales bacterium]